MTILPSWNTGGSKNAIVEYVTKTTTKGSINYIPVSERIAVFDNDGTLWPENPIPFQLAYALDNLKVQVMKKPALKDDDAVKAALSGDLPALLADSHKGLLRVMALTHSGMTTTEFNTSVAEWISKTKHPKFKKPYYECVYQPMLEVLTYLRANNFKTFIVSGGGADFMRVWSERVYGIPPEQVIGSNARTRFEFRDGKPVLLKTLDHFFIDDKEGKPVGIHQHIGRRPVICIGNSDGDKAMMEYTTIGNPRLSLGVIIHHTDAEREYAYDAKPASSGKLVDALADAPKQSWLVVDMKKEWKRVFPFEK
ncbi:MAG: HAD family hydrolase [Zavarzinella sp.]